jgi:nicotinate-nucleotide adenylyltransferase
LTFVAHQSPRGRSIAILGGSFDPIHVGHLAIARAAQRRFHLDEIHFVVSGRHPFRQKREQTPFPHRYAMVALACAEHAHCMPSLAEAGAELTGITTNYSVDTVRHFRQHLLGAHDKLYFILGADSFVQIPMWKDYERLLDSCDFIVASRPGYKMDPLRLVIPPDLLRRPAPAKAKNGASRVHDDAHTILLRKTAVHLLDAVRSHVSSTEVRRRRARGESIHGLVPPRVEDYILQQALYAR